MSEVIVMAPDQVQELVRQAAHQGAAEVLRQVATDLGSLREILEAQRGVLTKAACMSLMGISSDTTYYKRCSEGLPFYTIGSQRFHILAEVCDWVAAHKESDCEASSGAEL